MMVVPNRTRIRKVKPNIEIPTKMGRKKAGKYRLKDTLSDMMLRIYTLAASFAGRPISNKAYEIISAPGVKIVCLVCVIG
ncbi:hypothetical protein TNCT_180391 [Trichonephila clavata]|uniref:Uncharacterized protein n=1 Tax=Trichonephila clavata TaxID=2740835 RepID=A0A8X6JAD1_TRICU|nr:hypothetical protein TNCT_180391 [Trichonephila clavata]